MKTKKEQLAAALVFATSISSLLITNILLGYFGGKWLDENYTQYPFGRLFGIVAGVFAAIWSIYQTIKNDFLKLKDKK